MISELIIRVGLFLEENYSEDRDTFYLRFLEKFYLKYNLKLVDHFARFLKLSLLK